MRKKDPIIIEKLIENSARELKVMQTELEDQPSQNRDHRKPGRWSRRFAASGKTEKTTAPKIRESY